MGAALSLCATSAVAQSYTPPDWLKRPTAATLLALFPVKAMEKGVDGSAKISCTITVQGTLRDCRVVSETPPDLGFGAAALALTPQFLMRPARRNGVAEESTVAIPINFEVPHSNAHPPVGSHLKERPSTRDQVYTHMPFREAPSHAQVVAAFPTKARAEKVSGVVSLSCRIRDGGKMGVCDIVREEPKGYGFAAAARSLSTSFVAPTLNAAGASVVGASGILLVTFDAKAIDESSPVIGKPTWRAIPQINNMAAVMPEAAKEAKVYKARVVMSCRVLPGGGVNECRTESEDPAGLGYGKAAESLSPFFRLSVWTAEGLPTVGGTVRIPLRFDLNNDATPAKP